MKTVSVTFCLLGGLVMLTSFVTGMISSFSLDDKIIQTIPFRLSKTPTHSEMLNLTITPNTTTVIWLGVPGRGIENSGLQLKLEFIDQNNQLVKQLNHEFGWFSTRRGSRTGQLYQIGKNHFIQGFTGKLNITSGGEWRPQYDGSITIKETIGSLADSVIPYSIGFMIGTLMLSFGVVSLNKKT